MKFSAHKLNIGYDDKTIIQNIDFEVNTGDFIVLIGKNGSGKSTLLKTLSGIIPVQSGSIYIDEQDTTHLTPKSLSQQISIVLTDKIDTNFTVQEVLQLGRQAYTNLFDTLQEVDYQIIEKVVDQLNLHHLLYKDIQKISDGERQIVMIARSLIQQTPIILLDEPTTHLDMENKSVLLKLLKEISSNQGKIIILSTHDINLVLPLTEKLWVVDTGRFEVINNPENEQEKIKHLFNNELLQYNEECQSFQIKLSE